MGSGIGLAVLSEIIPNMHVLNVCIIFSPTTDGQGNGLLSSFQDIFAIACACACSADLGRSKDHVTFTCLPTSISSSVHEHPSAMTRDFISKSLQCVPMVTFSIEHECLATCSYQDTKDCHCARQRHVQQPEPAGTKTPPLAHERESGVTFAKRTRSANACLVLLRQGPRLCGAKCGRSFYPRAVGGMLLPSSPCFSFVETQSLFSSIFPSRRPQYCLESFFHRRIHCGITLASASIPRESSLMIDGVFHLCARTVPAFRQPSKHHLS